MTDRVPTATERLAVCSWSLQPTSPEDLVSKLRGTGLHRVQLALGPLREFPETWDKTQALFQLNDLAIVSGMFECAGEDYSSLETIALTGGLAPDQTWEKNLANIRTTADIASTLGLNLVTFHAGFVPHDKSNPGYKKMSDRLRTVAALFAAKKIRLGLETGQETAACLAALLEDLKCPNLGVNFDPANMILYDKGNPVEAVKKLAPWVFQVHIKDALRTPSPGTWGQEAATGEGEVNWAIFLQTLKHLNFRGDLVLEREAGTQRIHDILKARAVVEKYFV